MAGCIQLSVVHDLRWQCRQSLSVPLHSPVATDVARPSSNPRPVTSHSLPAESAQMQAPSTTEQAPAAVAGAGAPASSRPAQAAASTRRPVLLVRPPCPTAAAARRRDRRTDHGMLGARAGGEVPAPPRPLACSARK